MKQQPPSQAETQNPGFTGEALPKTFSKYLASARNRKQITASQTSICVTSPAPTSTESHGHLSPHFPLLPRSVTLGASFISLSGVFLDVAPPPLLFAGWSLSAAGLISLFAQERSM